MGCYSGITEVGLEGSSSVAGWIVTVIALVVLLIATGQFPGKKESARIAIKLFIILLSILCLVFQLTSESTYSFFSTGATLENVFTAGTWEIPEEPQPPAGTGTAWAGEIPFSTGIAKYFTYNVNQGTEEAPMEVNLYQGADLILTGHVLVWNTQDSLYIKIMTLPTYSFDHTHMYPGAVPPEKHSPGNLGYQYSSEYITEYTYTITSIYSKWDKNLDKRDQISVASLADGETIYIAVHAQMQQSESKPISEEQPQETQPDPGESQEGQPESEDSQESKPETEEQPQETQPDANELQEGQPEPEELQGEQPDQTESESSIETESEV